MAEISILLCVCDDVRIAKCLDSIDTFCQVIVVANAPTKEVLEILRNYDSGGRFDYMLIEIEEKGISKARDLGAENASYDKLLFMDSDCVFLPGGIEEAAGILDTYVLADAKVDYMAVDFQSKIVAECRKKSVPNRVFCPGIAMRKQIKPLIGGYFFNHKIKWLEDSEINIRFRKAEIPYGMTENYVAVHDSLTFRQDLKSVYNYGKGKRLGITQGVFKKELDAIFNLIPSYFKESIFLGMYLVVWNLVYTWGFIAEGFARKDSSNE